MALANVITTQSGTNFVINVAAAQLSDTVTEKDFTVRHNGTAVSNTSYNKTTQNTLTYVGASLPSTTIEIRRKTSFDQADNLVPYATRFSTTKWNEALLRIQRWEEEVDLNGAGAIGAGVIPIPANDPYGSVWTSDTIYPPTRKVVWDKIETLAPKASPALTGVPTAPTAAFGNSSTQIATTAHVKNVLGNAPTISNPAVSNGSLTSPSIATPAINGGHLAGGTTVDLPALTDSSNKIVSASWVNQWYYNERQTLFAETQTIAVTSGAIQTPGNGLIWHQNAAGGGAYAGQGGTPNWCRVATDGWFRIDFKFEELSGATDYSYIAAFVERNTTSAGVFAHIARLGTWSWLSNTQYPMYSAWAIVGINWAAGVDKIISLRFQQNNSASATRNFKFWYNIERIRY